MSALPLHTPVATAAEMRNADRDAIDRIGIPGPVLMENAAANAWRELKRRLPQAGGCRIAVLCGGGNNGGDGLALARHASIDGAEVTVWLDESLTPQDDAALQLAIVRSIPSIRIVGTLPELDTDHFDAAVDAMLGTGARGALREPFAGGARWINSGSFVTCALDLPTGLDADTGRADADTVCADLTVTMAALKPGLLLGDGPKHTGDVVTVSIGAPTALLDATRLGLIDSRLACALLPRIEHGRNKYDRGLVAVIGGASGMRGAGVLASTAAMRSGAGVVRLLVPEDEGEMGGLPWPPIPPEIMLGTAFDSDRLEQTFERAAAIVIGPGLGRDDTAARLVDRVLKEATVPVILDADALHPYNGSPERLRERNERCTPILTPHTGEAARLLGVESEEIKGDPVGHARRLAELTDAIVDMKGAPSVVASPDGQGWISTGGNPGMATGGSGDVLSGILGACTARTGDTLRGTLLGVHLHTLCGDRAADRFGQESLTAGDMVDAIASALLHLHSMT